MPLVHLRQLQPPPAKNEPVAGATSAPQPPVAKNGTARPPVGPSTTAPANWGAFSQRLLDKLDTVERSASSPVVPQGLTLGTQIKRS